LKGSFGKETGFLFLLLLLLLLLVLVISELVERGAKKKKRALQNTGVLVLDRNLNKRKASKQSKAKQSKLLNESQGPTLFKSRASDKTIEWWVFVNFNCKQILDSRSENASA
jgi:Na+-transporting methylmalonyl-CoA/oxaloacetate decarboxylase gamma subunit